tara:strand:+ start:5263 stop:5505 length:243 start_codon:yes stop_codon:yes gene_type:complete
MTSPPVPVEMLAKVTLYNSIFSRTLPTHVSSDPLLQISGWVVLKWDVCGVLKQLNVVGQPQSLVLVVVPPPFSLWPPFST